MNIRPVYRREQKRRHRVKWLLWAAILIIAGGVLFAWWFVATNNKEQPIKQTESSKSAPKEPEENKAPEIVVPTIDLQPVIDGWVAKQSASYSVVVYDPKAKKIIGSNQPDRVLFAASLYKLFVAYLALEDFETGKQNPDEILISSNTRQDCVDRMIRESHSPCGEAMMADMGPAQLESRLKAMGITHTTFSGIQTTAGDNALILQYILEKRDLNEEHTASLRDTMHRQEQKYRNGLAKGMPAAVVDSKVGWNEMANYHDVGIIMMPDRREFIVAVLSQGNGSSKPIADLAATLYAVLAK